MVPKSAEWWQGIWNINFFCQSLKITSDILRCIRYSALQCHLAAAFYFKINVASFIFSDLSSDAWTFSCLYSKRYIIYGQNSHSQEFQQNNLLKSCIGSLVKPENCNRTASPSDLAHCGGGGTNNWAWGRDNWLWNDFSYSRGLMKFGCQTPSNLSTPIHPIDQIVVFFVFVRALDFWFALNSPWIKWMISSGFIFKFKYTLSGKLNIY